MNDFYLIDDGTLDTVIGTPLGELRYDTEFACDWRDKKTGELDLDRFVKEIVEYDYEDLYDASVHSS